MAKKQPGKVGSDPDAAGKVVAQHDFGAPEGDPIEREYASREARRQDKGGGVAHSGEDRMSGVGGNESGRGSSSGGDIDSDDAALVGIGDPHLHPPQGQPQPSIPASRRPTLDPPALDLRNPARTGDLDNESSTSADDVTNETIDPIPGFEGDITADEATGQSNASPGRGNN